MDGLRKCRGEAQAERWPSLEQGQDTLATARFAVECWHRLSATASATARRTKRRSSNAWFPSRLYPSVFCWGRGIRAGTQPQTVWRFPWRDGVQAGISKPQAGCTLQVTHAGIPAACPGGGELRLPGCGYGQETSSPLGAPRLCFALVLEVFSQWNATPLLLRRNLAAEEISHRFTGLISGVLSPHVLCGVFGDLQLDHLKSRHCMATLTQRSAQSCGCFPIAYL